MSAIATCPRESSLSAILPIPAIPLSPILRTVPWFLMIVGASY